MNAKSEAAALVDISYQDKLSNTCEVPRYVCGISNVSGVSRNMKLASIKIDLFERLASGRIFILVYPFHIQVLQLRMREQDIDLVSSTSWHLVFVVYTCMKYPRRFFSLSLVH